MTEETIYREELDRIIRDRFDNGIRDYLTKIKIERNLTDEDLEALTGISMADGWNTKLDNLSGLEVMRIIELCSDEKPTLELIDTYRVNTETDRLGRKLNMMLDLFGVSDEATLDRLLDKAIDVRAAISQVMEDCTETPKTEGGECHQKDCGDGCGKPFACESGDSVCKGRHSRCTSRMRHGNRMSPVGEVKAEDDGSHSSESGYVSYTHYNSETMDKPETKVWEWGDEGARTAIREVASEMADQVKSMADMFGIKPTLL